MEVCASAAIMCGGFALGGTIGEKVIAAIGIGLASNIIQSKTNAIRGRWLVGSYGVLNHDVRKALTRAFVSALTHLEAEYFRLGPINILPQNEKDSIRALFNDLKRETEEIFESAWGGAINEAQGLIQQTQDAANNTLWNSILSTKLLHTYSDHFRDFLRRNLFNAMVLCFNEELKSHTEESNRAWRAFQRCFLEGIQDDVRAVRASQNLVLQKLDALRPDLDQIAERLLVAQDEQFEALARAIRRRPLHAVYAGLEVAERVEDVLRESLSLFLGRSRETDELNRFVRNERSGKLMVTGDAGFGKTALLANWVGMHRGAVPEDGIRPFIAYHFFSHHYGPLTSETSGLRNVLRQLNIYHLRPETEDLPTEKQRIRDALYGALKFTPARAREPLVIVLDGLDQADELFEPPFPEELSDGIHIIASAGNIDASYGPLRNWLKGAKVLSVGRLSTNAITQLLARAGDGELNALADDKAVVESIDERTQGFPLYVHYLVLELLHAHGRRENLQELVAQTPSGFRDYIARQRYILLRLGLPREVWRSFALLAVAKGPLLYDELKAVTAGTDRDLQEMLATSQLMRWLRVSRDAGQDAFAFSHPLVAKAFEDALGNEAKQARSQLIKWCLHWRKHSSPYALRHLPDHLFDQEDWKTLVELSSDDEFIEAQDTSAVDLDARFRTLKLGIVAASKAGDIEGLGKCMLRHAWKTHEETRQVTPLEAVRQHSLPRALQLAELYEPEVSLFWQLLLAVALKQSGQDALAVQMLDDLSKATIGRLPYELEVLAAPVLSRLGNLSNETFESLQLRLLGDENRVDLVERLAAEAHFAQARSTARTMADGPLKGKALTSLASAVSSRDPNLARELLREALRACDSIAETPRASVATVQHGCLMQAAVVWSKLKEDEEATKLLSRALTLVEKNDLHERAKLLASTAITLFELKNAPAAWEALSLSLSALHPRSAHSGDFSLLLADVLGWFEFHVKHQSEPDESTIDLFETADALHEIAFACLAGSKAEEAASIARALSGLPEEDRIYRALACFYARKEDFDQAVTSARKISEGEHRAGAIADIAIMATGQESGRARLILQQVKEIESRGEANFKAWVEIAMAEAAIGDLDSALRILGKVREAAAKADNSVTQAHGLQAIAEAWFSLGFPEEGLDTLATAISHPDPGVWLRTLRVHVRARLAEVQVFAGDWRKANRLLNEALDMRGGGLLGLKLLQLLAQVSVLSAQLRGPRAEKPQGEPSSAPDEWDDDSGRMRQALSITSEGVSDWKAGREKGATEQFQQSLRIVGSREDWLEWDLWDETMERIALRWAEAGATRLAIKAIEACSPMNALRQARVRGEVSVRLADRAAATALLRDAVATLNEAVRSDLSWDEDVGSRSFWRHSRRFREVAALAAVAKAAAKTGERDVAATLLRRAQEHADVVERGERDMAGVAWIQKQGYASALKAQIAIGQAEAGFREEAVRTAETIRGDRTEHLGSIARALAETGDRSNFYSLLRIARPSLQEAYELIALLAKLHPDKTPTIVHLLEQESNGLEVRAASEAAH
ncbi:MAG: AAA family ATPase [Methyloceanibacter sp.]